MTDAPEAPDKLYHYCEANGFHGILASKTLWMSDACSMKDSQELRLILDKAVEQLEAQQCRSQRSGEKAASVKS